MIGIFCLSTLCQKFFYAVDDDDDGSSVKIKSNLNISGGPEKIFCRFDAYAPNYKKEMKKILKVSSLLITDMTSNERTNENIDF